MTILVLAEVAAGNVTNEYRDVTTLHPIGVAALLILGCWLFFAARKSALFPFMALICLIPSAQRIVIFGADFTLLRIMVMIGLARIISRGELAAIRPCRIDTIYLGWVLVGSLVYVIQKFDSSALVFVCGTSMDMLGAYVLTRALVQNADELRGFATISAVLAIVASVFFLIESSTGRNMLAVFGGVQPITVVRDGRLRCMGAFSHPILAGVFWAAIGALLVGAALGDRKRTLYIVGCISCVLIIGASASSTPVLGLAAAMMFWTCWPMRRWLKYAFIASPFMLIALHLVMDKPVWHLVARVSAVGGSTGYHRYVLIDGAIGHFHEWWLVGTSWTGHWSEYFHTWDVTNQYVFEGVKGGIWRLGLFLLLIVLVARAIGRAQRRVGNRSDELLLYGLGASLFVHCVCFIGVSYFGQIQYLWYMTLAIGASIGSPDFIESGTLLAYDADSGDQEFFLSEGEASSAV